MAITSRFHGIKLWNITVISIDPGTELSNVNFSTTCHLIDPWRYPDLSDLSTRKMSSCGARLQQKAKEAPLIRKKKKNRSDYYQKYNGFPFQLDSAS
jgi:hypothetical protein